MLGDRIESLLLTVGISSARIESWLGVDCGCAERRDMLNALDTTLRRVTRDGVEKTRHYLMKLIGGV
jgi:hypothetical protein